MTLTSNQTRDRGIALGVVTVLLSITLAACGSSPAASSSPASASSAVSAPVRIAHTTLGTVGHRVVGSGPPLVMAMGYAGTMEVWDPRFVDAQALAVRHPAQVRRLVLCATWPEPGPRWHPHRPRSRR